MAENLKRTTLKEAADLIEGHAAILSRGRSAPIEYNPLLVESLYAAVYILRSMVEQDEESFYPKVLRMLDDATIAQLDEITEYAKQQAVIKRTKQFQAELMRKKKEKEKEV